MRDLVDVTIRDNIKPVNELAVVQSINNMLDIRTGSLIFNRNIGTEIEELLFEPFLFTTKHRLEFIVRNGITSQVPLAKIVELTVNQNYEQRAYEVYLVIDIVGIGKTEIRRTFKSKG